MHDSPSKNLMTIRSVISNETRIIKNKLVDGGKFEIFILTEGNEIE